jgi:hypothetical protein
MGGDTGGAVGGATGGSTGGVSPCDYTGNQCSDVTSDAASVSGDEKGKWQTSGETSAWFRVRITEDNSNVFGNAIGHSMVLFAPGMNYDLFV